MDLWTYQKQDNVSRTNLSADQIHLVSHFIKLTKQLVVKMTVSISTIHTCQHLTQWQVIKVLRMESIQLFYKSTTTQDIIIYLLLVWHWFHWYRRIAHLSLSTDEARYVTTRRYVTNCYIPFREWRRYVTHPLCVVKEDWINQSIYMLWKTLNLPKWPWETLGQ
jgi:hypothetical protein